MRSPSTDPVLSRSALTARQPKDMFTAKVQRYLYLATTDLPRAITIRRLHSVRSSIIAELSFAVQTTQERRTHVLPGLSAKVQIELDLGLLQLLLQHDSVLSEPTMSKPPGFNSMS